MRSEHAVLPGLGMHPEDGSGGQKFVGSARCRPSNREWRDYKDNFERLQTQWPDAPKEWVPDIEPRYGRKEWEILCDFTGEIAVAATWDTPPRAPQPAAIIDTLEQLDAEHKEILEARLFEQVSFRALAKRLGMSHPQQAKRAFEVAVYEMQLELAA